MTIINKLEQGRAEFAYKCALDGSKADYNVEYKQYVKKVPMMIKNNGLGASMAFLFSKQSGNSKQNQAYKLIYKQLTDWQSRTSDFDKSQGLEKFIISRRSEEYRLYTMEFIAFLTWLRRFADGLIGGEE